MRGEEIIVLVDKLAEMARYVSNGAGQRTIYKEMIENLREELKTLLVEVGSEIIEDTMKEINENKEVVKASVSLFSRFLNLFKGG